jgi:hypothetical protein
LILQHRKKKKKGFFKKVTFLPRSEGGKEARQADIWKRALWTEGTAGAKALRWVQYLTCLKNIKMAILAGGEKQRGPRMQIAPCSLTRAKAKVKMAC